MLLFFCCCFREVMGFCLFCVVFLVVFKVMGERETERERERECLNFLLFLSKEERDVAQR